MIRIAVLISGSGTTLRNLIQCGASGRLPVQIVSVTSSRAAAGGLQFAADASIPHDVIDRAKFEDTAQFSRAIFETCAKARVDLVVMAGFLAHVLVPKEFRGRVMNIHPALIPAFCGKGFYGHRVHQAAVDHGVKISGCTVHFVDDEYDHGPIILQRAVAVEQDDSAESLGQRVFRAECEAYPDAIKLFAEGRLRIEGNRVRIMDA